MNSNLLKRFMPLIVFISLVVLLAIGLGLDPKKIPSALIGQTAPRLDLPQLYRPDTLITSGAFAGTGVAIKRLGILVHRLPG